MRRTWDAHGDIVGNHGKHARNTDKPIAGLLEGPQAARPAGSTLLVLGGRVRPHAHLAGRQGPRPQSGRADRLDGGRRRQGRHGVGSSDEVGYKAADSPYHIRDLHATILHCMGINHVSLTYLYNGRFQRLTGTAGELMNKALA